MYAAMILTFSANVLIIGYILPGALSAYVISVEKYTTSQNMHLSTMFTDKAQCLGCVTCSWSWGSLYNSWGTFFIIQSHLNQFYTRFNDIYYNKRLKYWQNNNKNIRIWFTCIVHDSRAEIKRFECMHAVITCMAWTEG